MKKVTIKIENMGNNGLNLPLIPIPRRLSGSMRHLIKPATTSFAMPSHNLFYMNFNFEDIKVKRLFIDPDYIFYIQGTMPIYLGFRSECSKRLTRKYIEKNISRISLGFIYASQESRDDHVFLTSGLFRNRRDLVETLEKVYGVSDNWSNVSWTILNSLFEKYGQGKYGK